MLSHKLENLTEALRGLIDPASGVLTLSRELVPTVFSVLKASTEVARSMEAAPLAVLGQPARVVSLDEFRSRRGRLHVVTGGDAA